MYDEAAVAAHLGGKQLGQLAGVEGLGPLLRDLAQRARQLGLDQPVLLRFAHWLGQVLQGDLGRSYVTGERVTDAILIRFPSTLFLSLGGVAIAMALRPLEGPIGALLVTPRGGSRGPLPAPV